MQANMNLYVNNDNHIKRKPDQVKHKAYVPDVVGTTIKAVLVDIHVVLCYHCCYYLFVFTCRFIYF